eukprot:3707067-Prymnesium_polylepis.1
MCARMFGNHVGAARAISRGRGRGWGWEAHLQPVGARVGGPVLAVGRVVEEDERLNLPYEGGWPTMREDGPIHGTVVEPRLGWQAPFEGGRTHARGADQRDQRVRRQKSPQAEENAAPHAAPC